ncbi:sensor histidine kinase [Mesorhizobium sp. NBSH29]|uniref:sensor histidine kinase n=1 Tax=Mesorhizobium sp. NBSH29 TaxID=2654249 RepID=UPI0021566C3A|nr:PAS domain S-box protein [Mesorhizobium sp. NBSH29]
MKPLDPAQSEKISVSRRSVEADLRRQLNAVLDNATVAVFVMNEHQQCTYMNAAAERLTGYSLKETQGRPLHDVVHHTHPDGRHYPLEDCPIDRAFPERNRMQGEETFVHKDGSFYPVAFTASPIRDDGGNPIGTIIEVRGIAEEKARDTALRESEARFRNMADHAPVMMWVTEPDGACTYINRAWYEFTGQSVDEAKGFGWLTATHPDDMKAAEDVFTAANKGQKSFRVEYRLRRADGTYRWAIDAAAPRFGPNGEFLGYIGSVIDIDDRKEAEERQKLLVQELHHRVKNNLATVQSIVNFTLRTSDTMDAFNTGITHRIGALARCHSLLTNNVGQLSALHAIILNELAPYDDGRRVELVGPETAVSDDVAMALAMAIHELTTNAAKYGSLSAVNGSLQITWNVTKDEDGSRHLTLRWRERGGPPVRQPTRRGFGSILLGRMLGHQLKGSVQIDYPIDGVEVEIRGRLEAPATYPYANFAKDLCK